MDIFEVSGVRVGTGVVAAVFETAQKEKFAAINAAINVKTGIFFIFHLFLPIP
jgi:hypothetical protein